MLRRLYQRGAWLSCRGLRKRPDHQEADYLADATTFADTHTVLTDGHAPLPYPVEQLREYLRKEELEQRRRKAGHMARPSRSGIVFDHIPIEEQCFVLFPGQGAQFVGMGKAVLDVPEARRVFEQANEVLGYDLRAVCLDGPASKLEQTIYCQPAVFVSSMAALEKLRVDFPDFDAHATEVAGFSVGEFSALVLAGVLSFEDALRIVKQRAEAMHECNQRTSAGMITVKVNARSQLDRAIKESREYASEQHELGVCEVANFLHCGLKVVGGVKSALHFLRQNQERFQFEVLKTLSVAGAFHTSLMRPAEPVLRAALRDVPLQAPRMNVYCNYTGKLLPSKPAAIRDCIVHQVSNPVKWEQSMQLMYRKNQDLRFPEFFEVGPGRQLGSILFQVSKKAFKNYNHVSC